MSIDSETFLGVEIPPIDSAGLKKFGLLFAGIIALLFGLAVPFLFGASLPWWPWLVGAIFLTISLVKPDGLTGFYRLWMRFGVIMNMIMSRIILGGVFLIAVIPTALILKLQGKDILGLKLDKEIQSYRTGVDSSDSNHMKKPY